MKEQEHLEAKKYFDISYAENPNHVPTLEYLGVICRKFNQDHAQAKLFKRITEIAPNYAQAHAQLASALKSLGQAEEAEAAFKKAYEYDPNHKKIRSGLAHLYLNMDRKDEAEELIKKNLADGDDLITLCMYAFHFHKLENLEDDIYLKKLHKLEKEEKNIDDGNKIILYRSIAHLYSQGKDYDNAFYNYKKMNDLQTKIAPYEFEADKEHYHQIKNFFDAQYISKYKDHGQEDERPVFIFGLPRAGTTLTEQILSSHPEIGGIGEYGTLPKIVEEMFVLPPDPSKENDFHDPINPVVKEFG